MFHFKMNQIKILPIMMLTIMVTMKKDIMDTGDITDLILILVMAIMHNKYVQVFVVVYAALSFL